MSMPNLKDDRQELALRRKSGLTIGITVCLAVTLGLQNNDAVTAPLWLQMVTSLPFALAGGTLAFFLYPQKNGSAWTQGHGARPRGRHPENPMIRRTSNPIAYAFIAFAVGLSGCSAMVVQPGVNSNTAMLSTYGAAFLGWLWVVLQVDWNELDIQSLKVFRHRVLLGMQRSWLDSQNTLRAITVCRVRPASSTPYYDVFAITDAGDTFAIGGETDVLEEAQFQAQRFADQLMIPRLKGMENLDAMRASRSIRGLKEDRLPLLRDWSPTRFPRELAGFRSVLPPLD